VRSRKETALNNVLKVVEHPHEDVGVVLARVPHFHFCWSHNHFKHEPAMYIHSYERLTDHNKTSFAKIIEFVGSFSRSEVVAEDGNPVLDSRGNPVTKPRLIDTRSLMLSKDPMTLLGRLCLLFFVTTRFFLRFILLFIHVCYMCSYVINCLCVYFWSRIVEFGVRRVF
jgi:hypothetical protein